MSVLMPVPCCFDHCSFVVVSGICPLLCYFSLGLFCLFWVFNASMWTLGLFVQCVHVCAVVSIPYDPIDCSPPGSSFDGISQAKTLQWVTTSCSRGPLWPRDQDWVSCVSHIVRWILYQTAPSGKPQVLYIKYIDQNILKLVLFILLEPLVIN